MFYKDTKIIDYYQEYFDFLDCFLTDYVDDFKNNNDSVLYFGDFLIETPLKNRLYYQTTFGLNWRDKYNEMRIDGTKVEEISVLFRSELDALFYDGHEYKNSREILCVPDIRKSSWYQVLKDFQHQFVIYIYNKRQLEYLSPIICAIHEPVLLLTEYEIPDDTDLPEYVTSLTLTYTNDTYFTNLFLDLKFPFLSICYNTFYLLIKSLSPKCVIVLEGCHSQELILGDICRVESIPSFCIQQGWPSLMHTAFRRFNYKYFLTWGERFNHLWKQYNPLPEFSSTGYLYKVGEKKCQNAGITFFLQAPILISDSTYFDLTIKMIIRTAEIFSNLNVYVRAHPEFKLSSNYVEQINKKSNIHIVSFEKLEVVFSKTKISIAHFSSIIMESLVHGTIPLVFDPTSNSVYNPNIEDLVVGFIAKSPDEFIGKLFHILENEKEISRNIAYRKSDFFCAVSNDALQNTVNQIKKRL